MNVTCVHTGRFKVTIPSAPYLATKVALSTVANLILSDLSRS